MRLNRVYVGAPLVIGSPAILAGDAANHIGRVLRLRPGDPLTLFDGRGGEYAAQVTDLQGAKVIVQVGDHRAVERESKLHITVLQGIARGDRMDTIVQKATELGVARLVPVMTERSVVKLSSHNAHRKHAHWLAIAIGACEQCGRNRLLELTQPQTVADAISRECSPDSRCVMLEPDAASTLHSAAQGAESLTLLIGPEGGLSSLETEIATRAGFTPCRLGPRILRTETASLAAIAALQAIAGDFA